MFSLMDHQIRELQSIITNHETSKTLYKDTLVKYLTELEEMRRKDRRMWLNEQGIRLGRVSSIR